MTLLLALVLGYGPLQDQTTEAVALAADPQEAAEAAGNYSVPEGSPQEILQWMGELSSKEPDAETREERVRQLAEMQHGIVNGADAILQPATDAVDDQTLLGAVRLKCRALRVLSYLGDKQAAGDLVSFVEGLKKDQRRQLADEGTFQLLATRVDQIGQSDARQLQTLVDDLLQFLKSTPLDIARFSFAMQLAEQLGNMGQSDPAATAYEGLANLADASGDPRLAPAADQFRGIARRMRLPGNEMQIEGTTIGGQSFDWSAYRGKVVLVDFWATWCGPCIAELPNVKKNYELYHDRGFDVVGISLDQDRDRLLAFLEEQEIPWVTLIGEPQPNGGLSYPAAEYYGVTGIPTVILVDKQGKVVSLNARGPQLGRLLARLIGPAVE